MDETELDLSKLLVTLSTDKPSSVLNETVEIMLTVTNTGNSNITLTFSDAQVADFEILTKEGKQVYLWPTGRVFAQMITNVTIPAGKIM